MLQQSLDISSSRRWLQVVVPFLLAQALLIAGSWASVPMFPVPMTMQTFAVTFVGALLGPRLGALAVCAWLVEAACGAPVLASGTSGPAAFFGATAGYLWSFPLAAALVGTLVRRARGRLWLIALAMLAGNALSILMGYAWLSHLIGLQRAFVLGVAPFALGAVLKSALAAATMKLVPLRPSR